MTKTRAAICRAFGEPLTIEEVVLAEPGEGQVEVRLSACAICHSDILYADGGWGGDLPAVYGHEASGVVTRTGPGVRGYAVGDDVLVTLIRSCGTCPNCASGTPTTCSTGYSATDTISLPDGTPVVQAMASGAFAEDVVVHQSQLALIPSDIPKDSAALISCGVITGVGAAVNTAGIRPGQNVVVIGAGGVGLNAIQGARIAGAARIVAVDMVPEKLEAAKSFGATHGVLASDAKPWRAAQEIMGGGADAVLVTVGAIPVYETAPRYLKPGGIMVMVGMPATGARAEYEPVIIAAAAQGMRGTKMGDVVLARDIPWIVELYRQGRLKLDEMISGRWRLEEINAAIADTKSGAALRNVIIFDR